MRFWKTSLSTFAVSGLAIFAAAGLWAQSAPPVAPQNWSWEGPLGSFDRAQLQRGLQVYQQVCAACHSLNQLSYRNLETLYAGDPRKSEIVQAIAAQYTVSDLDEDGQRTDRPAKPSDAFAPPYPNEKAARAANNGAYPVDLSLITKARAGGADYVYALLTGYTAAPADLAVPDGMHYNAAFPGHLIAMPAPLQDAMVPYAADQPPATTAQMGRDVTAFLAWVSEPELEDRKRTGIAVLLFLGIWTVLLYISMKRIWARVTP